MMLVSGDSLKRVYKVAVKRFAYVLKAFRENIES